MKKIIRNCIKTALLIVIIISSLIALIIHYQGESFDPVQEIQILISQDRRDEARDIAELFSNSNESKKEIEELKSKLRYTTPGKIKSFLWDGVIKGKVHDAYSGMGAIGSDMVVVGDIRDIGIESWNYIRGNPDFDLMVLGLSLSGLTLSASPFIHAPALLKSIAKYLKRFPDLAKKGLLKMLLAGKLSYHHSKTIWDILKKTTITYPGAYLLSQASRRLKASKGQQLSSRTIKDWEVSL